jgi:hypothetical protein
MSERLRKITVNVSAEVLENATRATGKGVTLTVIEGPRDRHPFHGAGVTLPD